MREKLKKEIQSARPSLRLASPLAHWVMVVMGVFNVLLGISLITGFDSHRFTASLLIVNDTFTSEFWGVIFMLLGFVKLYSLKVNNWNLARNTLLTGVSLKAAWAVALTVRTFISPGTMFVNLIWVALAAIQMGTYVFFMPPAITSNKTETEI